MEEAKQTKLNSQITGTIKGLVSFMGACGEIRVDHNIGGILVSVYTEEDARGLIGKNGQNLNALEHILRLIMNKQNVDFSTPISLDINDYKKSRALLVLDIAKEAVERVRNTR